MWNRLVRFDYDPDPEPESDLEPDYEHEPDYEPDYEPQPCQICFYTPITDISELNSPSVLAGNHSL